METLNPEIVQKNNRVLAEIPDGHGNIIKIDEATRKKCAVFTDGRIFVTNTTRFDPDVENLLGKLKRVNFKYSLLMVDAGMISRAYSGVEKKKQFEPSEMQTMATDIFKKAAASYASDIHIEVYTEEKTDVLFRVYGDVAIYDSFSGAQGKQLVQAIYQAMTSSSDSTFDISKKQDGKISDPKYLPDNIVSIRISTGPMLGGTTCALRLMYKVNETSAQKGVDTIGLHPSQIASIRRLKSRPFGVIIVSGPTGSGKSTTLSKLLAQIIEEAGRSKRVFTVEDPVELPIPGAVQTSITNANSNAERAEAFSEAIRLALRQDPDIIMVSEVRDIEAGGLVFECALTGHITYTTIHANSAFHIPVRLQDMGIEPFLVYDESIFIGGIAQRLVPTLCPDCKRELSKEEGKLEETDVYRFQSAFQQNYDKVYIRNKAGCASLSEGHKKNPKCRGGSIGRTAIGEVVEMTSQLMAEFQKNGRHAARQMFIKQGGLTLMEHARSKVMSGHVDPFDAEVEVGYFDIMDVKRVPTVVEINQKVS